MRHYRPDGSQGFAVSSRDLPEGGRDGPNRRVRLVRAGEQAWSGRRLKRRRSSNRWAGAWWPFAPATARCTWVGACSAPRPRHAEGDQPDGVPDAWGHAIYYTRRRMKPFDLHLRTRVVFGAGTFDRLGDLARAHGFKTTLLVADAGMIALGLVARARQLLEHAGIRVRRRFTPSTPIQTPRWSRPGASSRPLVRWTPSSRSAAAVRWTARRGSTSS